MNNIGIGKEFNQQSIWLVLVAAGSGSRMGTTLPKQYLCVEQYPLLCYILAELLDISLIAGVMVVVAKNDQYWQQIDTACFKNKEKLHSCQGGAQRVDSVVAGLNALTKMIAKDDWVLVHDAARVGFNREDFNLLITALATAENIDGLVPALQSMDTLKQLNKDGIIEKTLDRSKIWRAQTPQCFRFAELKNTLQQAIKSATVTDESSAMEAAGFLIKIINGSETNFKLTTADDLTRMKQLLHKQIDENKRVAPQKYFSKLTEGMEKIS